MIKIFLFGILILLVISIILILFFIRRKQAFQIYSIRTFLSSSSNNEFQDEPNELKVPLIQTINHFFKEIHDDFADDGDIGGGDDAGE